MDSNRAQKLEQSLQGSAVGGWAVEDLIGHGKSAAVFRASKETRPAALKVFDPELVDRFGIRTQKTRIERELSLRGKPRHPNLVQIYDGGQCSTTGHLYLAMELIDPKPLSEVIAEIPRDQIHPLIAQVAGAARFLEEIGLAHRDIKPANISTSPDMRTLTLLDLGVVRPIDSPGGTDADDTKRFVGTLQYSSPEFLLREEEDSAEGWRAVTFYQLGAVLYDLIEQRPLFADEEPYARLVDAVLRKKPKLTRTDVSPRLRVLTQSCLVKDPQARLRLVRWEDFDPASSPLDATTSLRDKIRLSQTVVQVEDIGSNADYESRRILEVESRKVWSLISSACSIEELLPPKVIEELASGEGAQAIDSTQPARRGIRFGPDGRSGLKSYLLIECCVELVDSQSQALAISAQAWRSSEPEFAQSRSATDPIYAGPFDQEALDEKIRQLLLGSFARALELDSAFGPSGESMICMEVASFFASR